MKTKQQNKPSEKPTIEYTVVEDEFNVIDGVFDELFEQIEKEIRDKS